ncbi:MAG: GNAT family N-acetyltransferase [Alphaproteobacteria bacterium]|nr:MAG: GNAT family N-acetyltransferase [Alphaproteobacteria bacterium]
MTLFRKPRYVARLAQGPEDLRRAQALRYRAFRAGRTAPPGEGLDADAFDALCDHVLIEETRSGRLVGCFRIMPLASGREIARSYSAQHYNLSALEAFPGPMAEIGRFCVDPDIRDPDILRTAWAAVTAHVDANGTEMLFGCSSFMGTEAEHYRDAFALLAAAHLAPRRWLPRVKAPRVFRFARRLRLIKPDLKLAMKRMPPLLRAYLGMGVWVSDHAVIDRELDTLHVFTGLEIRAVPQARARRLRALSG